MTTMNLSLPEALQAFVDEQVASRGYADAAEYVRDLIRRAREEQQFQALIQEGLDSGPGETVDEAWFDALREEIRNAGAA